MCGVKLLLHAVHVPTLFASLSQSGIYLEVFDTIRPSSEVDEELSAEDVEESLPSDLETDNE